MRELLGSEAITGRHGNRVTERARGAPDGASVMRRPVARPARPRWSTASPGSSDRPRQAPGRPRKPPRAHWRQRRRPGLLGPGDAHVDADRTGLDHVRGDQARPSGGRDHDVGLPGVLGRSMVPVWHRVTVAFSLLRVSSRPSGRPTVVPRPITQTLAPPSGMPLRRSSSTTPRGVQGSGPGAPSTSRPRLTGCRPSTSLSGSTGQQGRELVQAAGQRQLDQVAGAGRVGVQLVDLGRAARRRWSTPAARPGSRRCPPRRSRGACPGRRSGCPGRRRPGSCPGPG